MMMSLILLILMYSVICISGWIPSSSHLKPCVRKTISNAILISSFSLTNPITSIAVNQPTVFENKDIVSLANSAEESIDKQRVTNKKEVVPIDKRIITSNKEIVSTTLFADEPIAPRDYARRLDRLEFTYFSKDDAAGAFKGVKDDTAALFKGAKDDAAAAFKDLKDDVKEARAEFGILFVVAVSLAYRDREQMRAEMAAAENRTKTEMIAAAKTTKDEMDAKENRTNFLMVITILISILSAYSALTPESKGFKYILSVWNAVQDALHIL